MKEGCEQPSNQPTLAGEHSFQTPRQTEDKRMQSAKRLVECLCLARPIGGCVAGSNRSR
jgi:hypothetical protein